jgi:IS5 family transposase
MVTSTLGSQLHQLIEPFYPKVVVAGRPPVALARILHRYLPCSPLAYDKGIENVLYDILAIGSFAGLSRR